jgi:thiamine-monophosphate kinase
LRRKGHKLALDEFELINRYFKPLATKKSPSFALGNDAAVYTPQIDKDLVFTKDVLVAGIHFFHDDQADLIARKAVRVNLSDLAAMGAEPIGYLLGIALPKSNFNFEEWVRLFAIGLKEEQTKFGWTLWGGDTVSTTGPITISITAIGQTNKGKALSRSGASVQDKIYVSGTIGDSACGLAILHNEIQTTDDNYLIQRYRLPVPRLKLGKKLINIATSVMDISDGLIGDLGHICNQSAVGATLYSHKIPLSKPVGNLLETKPEYNRLVWNGGDDYELLFTIPEKSRGNVEKISRQLGIQLTEIGEITNGNDVRVIDEKGSEINNIQNSFRHF